MSTVSAGNVAEIRGCATRPVTAILQPSNTGCLYFAKTNGTVGSAVALGIMSPGFLAQIATVSEYVRAAILVSHDA